MRPIVWDQDESGCAGERQFPCRGSIPFEEVTQTIAKEHVKPVILIFGPSGVGKSWLLEGLEGLEKTSFLCVHIDTDRPSGKFAANGFPADWDDDFNKVDFAHIVPVLRSRLAGSQSGAAMSFPTTYLFTAERLTEAARLGATPLVLWGAREHCVKAAEERIKKKKTRLVFDPVRYARQNDPTFVAYGLPDYDRFRVDAFSHDGSRYPWEEWVARLMKRIAG